MKISITSTDMLTTIDGVRVRVWNGVSERGTKCLVFVHMLRTESGVDVAEFTAELEEQQRVDRYIDVRHIP